MTDQFPPPGRTRVRHVPPAAPLQWANGTVSGQRPPGVGPFVPLVGFHVEIGRLSALDAALRAAATPQVAIRHRVGDTTSVVRHWWLGPTLALHLITSGPPVARVAAMRSPHMLAATALAGIGVRWSHGRSRLAVRGFLAPLAQQGQHPLVQLSARGRLSEALLTALLDHGQVCAAADAVIDRTAHPALVTAHELALPLGPGAAQPWGPDGAPLTPFVAAHPATVDAASITRAWRSDATHAAALAAWPAVVDWAHAYQLPEDRDDA